MKKQPIFKGCIRNTGKWSDIVTFRTLKNNKNYKGKKKEKLLV